MKKPWLVRAFSKTLTLTLIRFFPSHRSFSSSSAASISVKKVTKSNFDSSLEDLRRHVQAADFVSIDLEMTGVTSAPWRESLEFDRSDVRYLKVKDSAEKFAVVQFGVCPFRWDEVKESFVAHPHNFYIFPRKELPVDGPSYEFLCQTTSIDFLAKYQFDFNACIHEGISYLSRAQEAEALRTLGSAYEDELVNSPHHSKDVRELSLLSTFDILFTERMKHTFCEWRDGLLWNSNQIKDNCNGSMPQFLTFFFKMRPALKLNGFTSHQLRLIELVVRKHFKDLAYVRIGGENSSEQKLIVYCDSDEDRALLMKEVKEDLHTEIEGKVKAAVGFRHVIDLLSSEQKLIIGHNCFLDIAHIHSKFFGPLPPSMEEFAASVHRNFPFIVDTKQLLKANAIQHLMKKNSTALSSAFALLCPQIAYVSMNSSLPSRPGVKVDVPLDDLRSSNWNSGAKHEAGYDAFMTGCIFAQICTHLGIDFKPHSSSMQLAQNDRLQKHMNLLYLTWNSGTLIDLTTGGSVTLESSFQNKRRRYAELVYENMILIWGFSTKFKPRELRDCICKVFGQDSVTSMYYLDETAAFIQFSKSDYVSDFLILKDTLETRNDPVSVLHPLAKLLEGGTTRAVTYDVYKQICSSPISKVLFADQAEAVGIKFTTAKVDDSRELETEESDDIREIVSENQNPNFVGKSPSGKKGNKGHHFISCEDILDSIYVNQSLLRKRTKTL